MISENMISMMANIPANTMNAMAMTNKKKRLFKKCLIIHNQDSQDNQDVGDVVLYDEHNTIIPPKKEVSQQKKRKTKKVGLQNSGKMALFLQLAQPNEQGVSRWVNREEWVNDYAALALGNGCPWGRKGSKLDEMYVIEKDTSMTKGNSIDAIRLNGLRNQ